MNKSLLIQGWRKQFHIGQASSSNMDIHVWKAGLPTGFREHNVQVLLCFVQHANARGVWGHAPQEMFEK